jgi:hypothetical protein
MIIQHNFGERSRKSMTLAKTTKNNTMVQYKNPLKS